MPVDAPRENAKEVEQAYQDIFMLLSIRYKIQAYEPPFMKEKWLAERKERNDGLKEAIRLIFELEAWESW